MNTGHVAIGWALIECDYWPYRTGDMNKDMHAGRSHGKVKSTSASVKELQKSEPRLGQSSSSRKGAMAPQG